MQGTCDLSYIGDAEMAIRRQEKARHVSQVSMQSLYDLALLTTPPPVLNYHLCITRAAFAMQGYTLMSDSS